jgi:hypothetical protein
MKSEQSYALALYQSDGHCRPHDALEDMPQHITLAKTTESIGRERRIVWNGVVEIELAKPSIGQMLSMGPELSANVGFQFSLVGGVSGLR